MYGQLANPPLFSLLLGAPLPPLSPPRWAAAAAAAAAAGRAAKGGVGKRGGGETNGIGRGGSGSAWTTWQEFPWIGGDRRTEKTES